jgi:hypothetical protein
MNKFINDFIKDLSIKSNKHYQKKVFVWKQNFILPFDSAPGTMHGLEKKKYLKRLWMYI